MGCRTPPPPHCHNFHRWGPRNLSTSRALKGKAGSREMVISPYKRGKGAREAHGSGAPQPIAPSPQQPHTSTPISTTYRSALRPC